jgi:hypothetical protein
MEKRRVLWTRNDGCQVTRTEVRCACGRWVLCAGSTNTCECGADYNMGGQRLASRAQWGEETGESVSQILDVDRTEPGQLLEGDW